jgi:hypothetical protein
MHRISRRIWHIQNQNYQRTYIKTNIKGNISPVTQTTCKSSPPPLSKIHKTLCLQHMLSVSRWKKVLRKIKPILEKRRYVSKSRIWHRIRKMGTVDRLLLKSKHRSKIRVIRSFNGRQMNWGRQKVNQRRQVRQLLSWRSHISQH